MFLYEDDGKTEKIDIKKSAELWWEQINMELNQLGYLSEQIKTHNNEIRSLMGEYKQIEPECRDGVRVKLERMKKLCKECNNLYEKQNDLKGQKWKIEGKSDIIKM